jgi:AbrB family looped-hinge helix DNA binding protein
MVDGMKTTIDSAGRLVIPKAIRDAAGLEPGMPLDVRLRDGRIEIEPEELPVTLVRRPGGLLVAIPVDGVEPLTAADVQRALDELREERGRTAGA